MKSHENRSSKVVAALVIMGVFFLLLVSVMFPAPCVIAAQPVDTKCPAPQKPKPKDAGGVLTGISGCETCHVGADQGQAVKFVEKYQSNEFIRLNESLTWVEKDVHSIAYNQLAGPLGQHMEKILGQGKKDYKVNADVRCLTCHSVDLTPEKLLTTKVFDDFATNEGGVNCTVCHGLGKNWQSDHYEEPRQKGQPIAWRTKNPATKFDRGMEDLRHPVVKAKLCVSCHVGAAEEGKVITHQMYAAGHPPLPPFDLASYIESEPRHWGYASELKFVKAIPPGKAWDLFRQHPAGENAEAEISMARHLAVGAIASLVAEVRQLRADALTMLGSDAKGEIDFARFDCYACHHDLKHPSDRQARGYPDGPPGRATLRAATGAFAQVVANHAKDLQIKEMKELGLTFEDKWAAVRKAATARSLGDPVKLDDATCELIKWCESFLTFQQDYNKPIYTQNQSERLATMLEKAATDKRNAADPESATVLTWGYLALARDLKTLPADLNIPKLAEVIPLAVRLAPHFAEDKDKRRTPAPPAYKQRMKMFREFGTSRFLDAFAPLVPKK